MNAGAAASESGPPSIIAVPDPANDPEAAPDHPDVPATTAPIPPIPGGGAPAASGANNWSGDPVVNYDGAPQSAPSAPGIGSIAEFMAENENEVPQLGLAVRQDQRKLNSGEAITGLLVESVSPASPAAIAGIKGFQRKVLTAIEAVAMVAGMAFPPAAPLSMLVPVLESAHVGEHYDLIVAVDGYRVSNTMDFQDCMRDAQPGQTVYLSVVRDGKRMQVPVKMPG